MRKNNVISLKDINENKERKELVKRLDLVPECSKLELYLKPSLHISSRSLKLHEKPNSMRYPIGRLTGYFVKSGIPGQEICLSAFCERRSDSYNPLNIAFNIPLRYIKNFRYDICVKNTMQNARFKGVGSGNRDNLIWLTKQLDKIKLDIGNVFCGDRLEILLEDGLFFDRTTFRIEKSDGCGRTPLDSVFGYFLGNWCENNGPKVSLFYAEWDRDDGKIGFEVPWDYVKGYLYHPVYLRK